MHPTQDLSHSKAISMIDPVLDYENVGELHNNGLYYLITNSGLDTNSSNIEITTKLTSILFPFVRKSEMYYSYDGNSIENSEVLENALNTKEYCNAEKSLNTIFANLSGKVDPKELSYITTCDNYFDEAKTLNLNREEIYLWLNDSLTNLMEKFKNDNWAEGSGDLSGGYIATALYSTSFWLNHDSGYYNNFPPIYDHDTYQSQFLVVLGPS